MAEVRLQGARVGALVRKLKAASVPEHVRLRLEAQLCRDAQPRHHLAPTRGREGRAALTGRGAMQPTIHSGLKPSVWSTNSS